MVTAVPIGPLVGVKAVIAELGITVKLVALVAVPPRVVTLIGPVVVPEVTMAVRLVTEAEDTVPVTPLNLTSFLLASGSKLVPVIVTAVPGRPLLGVKLVMVGAATVVNWLAKALSGWPLVSVMAEVSESVYVVPAASGALGTTNSSRPCSPGLIVAATAPPLVSVTLVLVSIRTSTGSEKRTPMMSVFSTPVALLGGVTWLTTGAIVSAGVGVYSSVLARMPALFRPPVINTNPVGSSVAVWSTRAVASPGVTALKLFAAGVDTSGLASCARGRPPAATSASAP